MVIFLLLLALQPTTANDMDDEMATIMNITDEVRQLYNFMNISDNSVREIYLYYIELKVVGDEKLTEPSALPLLFSLFQQTSMRSFQPINDSFIDINQLLPQVIIVRDVKRRHIEMQLVVVGNVFSLQLQLNNQMTFKGTINLLQLYNLVNIVNGIIVSSQFVSSTSVVNGIDHFNLVHTKNYFHLDFWSDLPCGTFMPFRPKSDPTGPMRNGFQSGFMDKMDTFICVGNFEVKILFFKFIFKWVLA
jgi:hypothetical protein